MSSALLSTDDIHSLPLRHTQSRYITFAAAITNNIIEAQLGTSLTHSSFQYTMKEQDIVCSRRHAACACAARARSVQQCAVVVNIGNTVSCYTIWRRHYHSLRAACKMVACVVRARAARACVRAEGKRTQRAQGVCAARARRARTARAAQRSAAYAKEKESMRARKMPACAACRTLPNKMVLNQI